MDSLPPAWSSAIFNTGAFRGVKYLTRQEADLLYLSVAAGRNLPLIDGITPGIVSASKAVIVDSLKNITGFNSLTATSITADTLNAVNQFNCTGDALYSKDFGSIVFSGAHANISFSGVDSNIQLTGNSSIINMSGASSSLTLSGNSTKILLNGTGGYINLANTQASNNISTGALRCAGGAYFGNDCVFATQASFGSSVINQTNAAFLVGISAGTVSASKCVVVDINKDITGFRNLTATSTITSSILSATGSIQCINASGGDMLKLASTSTTARNTILFNNDSLNWEFGTRSSAAGNPNTMYWYRGGYLMLLNSSGILSINTTQTQARLNLGGVGALGISMNNDTSSNNKSAFIGTSSSASFLITAQDLVTPLSAQYTFQTNGSVSIAQRAVALASPRYALDFGAQVNDVILNLYQGSAGTKLYGFGAASSSLYLHADQNFKFYTGTTANGALGTSQLLIESNGNLTATNNVFATSYFAKGFSTTGLTGSGLKMHWSGTAGQIFSYDYTGTVYKPTAIGNNNIYCGITGFNNMNTVNTTTSFPLAVFGTGTATRSGTYGWLAPAGASSSTGFTNRPFTIYSEGGILVDGGEIDSFSDLRLKYGVKLLSDELCDRFIQFINPISFHYIHNNQREHYGFSAQELMRFGFNRLVGFTSADQPLPAQVIECYDGSKIDLPSDVRLTVTQLDIIPILTCCIQKSRKRLQEQEKLIKENEKAIAELRAILMADNGPRKLSSNPNRRKKTIRTI